MKSTQKRIAKINSEILQIEQSIKESQEKLETLKKEKIKIENAEIVSLIRKTDLSVDDIAELISDFMTVKKSTVNKTEVQTSVAAAANNILKGNDNQ